MASPLKASDMRVSGSAVKSSSPIKVKDYFVNPLHRIKQPTFVEIGFTQSTLNTFVKSFTNRGSNRFISFSAIQEFIRSFTNNSPRLIKTYEDFFKCHFKITEDNNISLENFLQFFMREDKKTLEEFDEKGYRQLFADISDLTPENLLARANHLEVPMTAKEARNIVKMVNYSSRTNSHRIEEDSFLKIMISH